MRKKLLFCLIIVFLTIVLLLFWIVFPVFIRIDDSIDLGNGYYYVQDYPQCICRFPKPGKVIIPMGDKEEIVVRVLYNDSIIIAVCSPYYYSQDSTIFEIATKTGEVSLVKHAMIDSVYDDFKEIRNLRRYKK